MGFSKTTLLSTWVAGIERPVAWLSLDEGDNDPARFWAYVSPIPDHGPLLPDSQSILEYLERANLFVVRLDDEWRWYRYHRLFADLLRGRLQKTRPDRVPLLHRRANREALKLAVGPDGRQLPAAGLPYVKMGDLMREWNELETASRYLERGIQ